MPISFAVSNNGFFKPSPRLAAFSISSISLALFVTSHAALFRMFAMIWIGSHFFANSSESVILSYLSSEYL